MTERESESSDRQFRVALDHALLQLRAFGGAPSLGAMRDAIAERASVGRRRARDRAGDADEFAFDCLRASGYDSIAVTAHVDKFEVRCVVGIADLVRGGEIARLGIFERAFHSVFQRQIDRVFILAARTFDGKERAQRMVLETVLERFGESGGGDGTGNESDADRLAALLVFIRLSPDSLPLTAKPAGRIWKPGNQE